jgi:hypothetical protein
MMAPGQIRVDSLLPGISQWMQLRQANGNGNGI